MSSHEVLETKTGSPTLEKFQHTQLDRLRDLPYAVEFLNRLTPEQWDFAYKVAVAVVEKFKEPGLKPEDINIVVGGSPNGTMQAMVMDTAPRGLRVGGLNRIFHETAEPFVTIEVNRQKIDTRKGLDFATYSAFVNTEMARGVSPMPDSLELAEMEKKRDPGKPGHQYSHHQWASTWPTGEEIDPHHVYSYRVDKFGYVDRAWNFAENDYGSTYFRPAVKIPSIEELRTSI